MCLVWCLTAGLTVRNIAAWLSTHSGISPLMGYSISPLNDLSQAACHPVLASAMYSATPAESVMVFCHCDAQEIAPFAIRTTCPEVEWWSSLFSPQSESEYLINPASEAPLYVLDFELLCAFEVSQYVSCILDMFLSWIIVVSW